MSEQVLTIEEAKEFGTKYGVVPVKGSGDPPFIQIKKGDTDLSNFTEIDWDEFWEILTERNLRLTLQTTKQSEKRGGYLKILAG